MILIINVAIFILRASHGRHLLSVSLLFMLFFVIYIKEEFNNEKFLRIFC